MKRLLAYLFIVLGLGLMVNVNSQAAFDVKADQMILINSNTNQVLYEKNSNQKINAASFTKIMTSIIAFDFIKKGKLSLKDKLIVSEKAWKLSASGYSAMFVMNGDSISVENLLRGLIIASGNDAAVVLAEGIAGSENQFVKLMNNKAKEIGLKDTKFYNSTGIVTNVTTVKDIALMSSYLVNNYSKFYYFFGEKQFTWNRTGGDPITQGNRNPLLYKNLNVDGLKTSYNQTDRYQLASSMYLKNNDDRLIVVGSGFKNKNDRARESAKLLIFGKTNYHAFKIAKKEPSQTQKVAKKNNQDNDKKTNNRKSILQSYDQFLNNKYQIQVNQKTIDRVKNYFKGGSSSDFSINNQINIAKIDKTNVTTQDFINYVNQSGISQESIRNNLDNNIIEETLQGLISTTLIALEVKDYNLSIDDRTLVKIIKENKNFHDENGIFQRTKYEKFLLSNNMSAVMFEERLRNNELQKLLFDSVVAGTITPKKKVKVAKKEPKQEEFKPKKTNQDNEAPVITIAEAITVDSQAYTLKGKVKDKSKIYLTINGRQVEVKKGKFELDRFSIDPDNTEEIKIVAIDQWNNRSEKTIKVTIDLKSTVVARTFEDLKPNSVRVKTDKNKIAIIIGIEKYENLTNLDAKYANRDAKAFRTYATRALGIKPSNIKMLIDEKATRSQALKAFKLWLPKIAGKGGKDIHIFFAGHGLASDNGEDLYILPQDGESSLLEDTAISRVELISLINKVNPNSVTMFFDTCYSGQTRDERMLVASLRPIRIVADEQDTPDNFTIFTASNYDQTSGSIEEAKHGMFSYYLMKGLEGNADNNKDKKITNGELIAYLKSNVSQEAFTQNREQDPMLSGDPDKVLISYQ